MPSATNPAEDQERPSGARRSPGRRRSGRSAQDAVSSESADQVSPATPGPAKRSRVRDNGSTENITQGSAANPVASDPEAAVVPTEADADTDQRASDRNRQRPSAEDADREEPVPEGLSFQQARTALDLLIAELQSTDLQVEEMLGLYQRAQAYADHCEAVLQRVDQDVIEWDVLQEERERNR